MTHPIVPGEVLRQVRLRAGETQLSLSMRIRERFKHIPGRKTSEETICRIEKGGCPLPITWARLRAVLPALPDLEG
jgi:transcriptional regulator with XRE-family HTH domain